MNTLEIQTINLDHFLPMEAIGYVNPEKREKGKPDFKAFSRQLHLCLGAFTGDWFLQLRKPHFQKKTDTWEPEQNMSETELARARFIATYRETKPLLRAMTTWLEPQYASIVFNNHPESGFNFAQHDGKQ